MKWESIMGKTKQKETQRKAARWLCISLVLVILSSIGAMVLQSNFGRTEIIEFKLPTENGQWLSGTIYKPKTASQDNKLPAVVTCHGYLNNSKMQDLNVIELSRRGMVVVAMDAYYHGKSSAAKLPMMESVAAEGIGMIPMVEYVSRLNYVDKDKIGVIGHSMGGMAVWCTLMYYGGQYQQMMKEAVQPNSDGGTEITKEEQKAADAVNKVAAGLPTSFIQFCTEDTFKLIHANVGINYGKYDEGAYALTGGNGDLSAAAAESLIAVNSIMNDDEKVDNVEIGKYYGDAEDKTLRVVYNPSHIHPWQHFSKNSAAYAIEFFEKSFGTNSGIIPEKQIWFFKEIFNLLGLFGILSAIVPMGLLLLEVPVFQSLKGEAPETMTNMKSKKGKLFFWGSWAMSWIISGVFFLPVSKLDKLIFPNQTAFISTKWFSQPSTNFILLWALFNALIGILLFVLACRMYKKEHGISVTKTDLVIGGWAFVKTLALAMCIFVGFYGLVFASEYFCGTDFRFWVMGICTFSSDKLLVLLQYLPFYFIYYLVLSIMNNKMGRVSEQKEWVNILLCGLSNVLGIFLINAAQYIKLFSTGISLYQDDRLYPMVVIPLIVWLFVAAYIGRKFYKATGKVWLGAMVNCLIILMIGIANTATLSIL